MRLVLDTNVLLAAFISRGVCHELVEHCERERTMVGSEFILGEIGEKVVSKFDVPPSKAQEAAALLRSWMELVEPVPLEAPICRDPDDDWVLATAMAGTCECIVTGDKDLLSLGEYRGVRILAPNTFWNYEASRRNPP